MSPFPGQRAGQGWEHPRSSGSIPRNVVSAGGKGLEGVKQRGQPRAAGKDRDPQMICFPPPLQPPQSYPTIAERLKSGWKTEGTPTAGHGQLPGTAGLAGGCG